MVAIVLAASEAELVRCFPVMQFLRPHIATVDEFVQRVQNQTQQYGYQLVYLEDEGSVKAVAGFRLSECLALGKFLYVDDLVTSETERSKGYGEQLFQWLMDYARQHQCSAFQLDSGVQRFAAHRFYFRQRLEISSYHFSRSL